ncbi:MAG: hypothetical protein ACJ758_03730, partial [Actinomycetota bacterium]
EATPDATPEVTIDDIEEEGLAPDTEAQDVLLDAEVRADEGEQEVLEAAIEGAPPAPEEAAMHVESEDQVEEEEKAEQGDVSLESILEDLKRREGRTE